MRKARILFALALLASSSLLQPRALLAQSPATPPPPITVTPAGTYALATLEFDTPSPWTYTGSFRDNNMEVDHGIGITQSGGTLEITGDKLRGTFQRRTGELVSKGPAPIATVTLDATLTDGLISGTCTVDGKSGAVKGRLFTEKQLADQNPIPADKNWPAFTGPLNGGTCAQPTGVALIDSLADARMLWRCEERIGNNMGSVNRFMASWNSASTIRTSGQSASPVLANGRLFLHQRIPAGTDFKLTSVMGSSTMKMEDVKAAGFEEIPWYAKEKLLTQADEVLVAIDAATGKTLWKTSFPLRAPNIQYHKDRGGDRTPVVIGDTLVAIAYNGGLFALNTSTGKLLWEAPCGKGFNTALVAAGDVVVAPAKSGSWAGYDVATGKLLWQHPGVTPVRTLATWRNGDQHFVLVPTAERVRQSFGPATLACLDAATGKPAWSTPFPLGSSVCGMTVFHDTLIAFEKSAPPTTKPDAAAKPAPAEGDDSENPGTPGQVSAYRLSTTGLTKLWSVPLDIHPYNFPLVVRQKFVVAFAGGDSKSPHKVIDLESGKLLSSLVGPRPGNGGYTQAMEDRVFVRHDGTHGRITMSMYTVDEKGQLTLNSPESWAPPIGGSSTSYHHPVMYPLVDGRLFMRQADGIYCWDLRKNAKP